jgi:hypothetical protein
MPEGIKVEGLKELRAELKKLDLEGDLKDANFAVAQLVSDAAKSRASGVSRLAARGARSLKPSRSGVAAQIRIGGPGAPEALGAEFGSSKFKQFKPWLGSGEDAGYFLWPTIRDKTPEVVEMYADAIDRIFRPAFPD